MIPPNGSFRLQAIRFTWKTLMGLALLSLGSACKDLAGDIVFEAAPQENGNSCVLPQIITKNGVFAGFQIELHVTGEVRRDLQSGETNHFAGFLSAEGIPKFREPLEPMPLGLPALQFDQYGIAHSLHLASPSLSSKPFRARGSLWLASELFEPNTEMTEHFSIPVENPLPIEKFCIYNVVFNNNRIISSQAPLSTGPDSLNLGQSLNLLATTDATSAGESMPVMPPPLASQDQSTLIGPVEVTTNWGSPTLTEYVE